VQQVLDFVGSETAMPTEGAYAGEFALLGPAGHRFGVYPKKGSHFRWSHEFAVGSPLRCAICRAHTNPYLPLRRSTQIPWFGPCGGFRWS